MAVVNGESITVMRSLPAGCISAVITDPPYCSGGFTESQRRAAKSQGVQNTDWFTGDNMGTSGLAYLLRSVAFESIRLMGGSGSLLMFCDWRMVANLVPAIESAGYRFQNLVVWDKGSIALGNGFRARHELVMHFTVGKFTANFKGEGNVITVKRPPSASRSHPTEKPAELMRRLIRVVAEPGGLPILDPFAGSGSTLVAAKQLGISAIGLERCPNFCEIARERLASVSTD